MRECKSYMGTLPSASPRPTGPAATSAEGAPAGDERANLPSSPPPVDVDATKRELEQEKLRLEVAALKRRWRPEYVSPIVALLIGTGTLLTAYLNGVFDVNSKLLEIRRHDLAGDVEKFQTQKERLQQEDDQLRESSKRLTVENQRLGTANKDLVVRGDTLTREVQVTEVKASINALAHAPVDLSLEDPTFKRIAALIGAAPPTSPEVQYAASAVHSASIGMPLSAALCVPLVRATHDAQWHHTMMGYIRKELSASIRVIEQRSQTALFSFPAPTFDWSRPVIYLELLLDNATIYEKTELFDILHQVFTATRQQPHETTTPALQFDLAGDRSDEARMIETLATWDNDVSAQYPAFWLDHLSNVLRRSNNLGLTSLNRYDTLEQLSPQAFGILAMSQFVEPIQTRFVSPNQTPVPDMEILLSSRVCPFATGFPLTCDATPRQSDVKPSLSDARGMFFSVGGKATVLHYDQRDTYRAWLANNPKLTSFWMDPDLKGLRAAPKSLVSRAVKKEWLTEYEVPDAR